MSSFMYVKGEGVRSFYADCGARVATGSYPFIFRITCFGRIINFPAACPVSLVLAAFVTGQSDTADR
jgi:hypothetical protein